MTRMKRIFTDKECVMGLFVEPVSVERPRIEWNTDKDMERGCRFAARGSGGLARIKNEEED